MKPQKTSKSLAQRMKMINSNGIGNAGAREALPFPSYSDFP